MEYQFYPEPIHRAHLPKRKKWNQNNVYLFLKERGPSSIGNIRFLLNSQHGDVASESVVVRILNSLIKKGKVTESNGLWQVV